MWRSAPTGLDVLFVGVHCSLEAAEERKRTRVDPRGLARGRLRTVHEHGIPYDRAVGPTGTAPGRLPEAAMERQEHVVGGGHLTR
ncbi:hypothetical protein AB0F17_41855 [Nonomuraea sp. NPDC026600]|uniref:phosphotransferase-like protein n=1 Tax=Nonomuraea sp. NPDC026600 TaxID=3155363 RepID=UPI00340F6854